MNARRVMLMVAIFAGLLWPAQEACAADPVLRLELDRSRVSLGDPFFLKIEMQGFSRGADIELPAIDGIDAYEAGHSTNISMVNGRFSSSTSVNYQLVARRPGSFTIGPVSVKDDGRLYTSETVAVEVTQASASPSAGGARSARAPAGGAVSDKSSQEGLFARVVADKTTAYLDEQITLRFQLYRREDVPLLGTRNFEPPESGGFWREDLGPEQHYTVTLNGHNYIVTELAWALFPTQPGELTIGPSGIICYVEENVRRRPRDLFSDFFDRDFFGRGMGEQRAIPLATDPVKIRVRPLPETSRPAGWSGSVGRYTASADIDTRTPRAGEPVTLTVTIRGSGHIQTIGEPVWPEWHGLRVFDSGEAVNVNKQEGRVVGEKQFTQVLIPARRGEAEIPAIRFVYFDPERGLYQTIATEPISLTVGAPGSAPSTDDATRSIAGDEMLYVETEVFPTLVSSSGRGFPAAWLIHLVPLGILVGSVWLRRRRDALAGDPILARRSRAYRRARRELTALTRAAPGQDLARRLAYILETYLGDWVGSVGAGLRRADLQTGLVDAGLPESLASRALTFLDWSDEVRFGAGRTEEAATRMNEFEGLLRDLEDGFRHGARPKKATATP